MLQGKKSKMFQYANSLMQGAHNGIPGHKAADGEEMET
jgi:hypothetical protein